MMKQQPVVIIGAGPYGLAVAAELRLAGIDVRVFGRPMDFWERSMPAGMFLRSSWDASTIGDPHRPWAIDRYDALQPSPLHRPIPLADFVSYGRWVQRQAVPSVDQRYVTQVARASDGFDLTLADGETLQAERVVVATGIAHFSHRPEMFAALPTEAASHSVDHADLSVFLGQRVVVIGAGQSAIESAALLSEGGASVEVICRAPGVRWLIRTSNLHKIDWLRGLLYARTDVGPVGLSRIVAEPDLFRRLPQTWQDKIAYRSIRPAASAWLLPRFGDVALSAGRSVAEAAFVRGVVNLRLDDGSSRSCDHVLLCTGFQVDLRRLPFLADGLVSAIHTVGGYPQLGPGFESSVPGLHIVGAPAAKSYGPVMRFVSGTEYTARSVTRFVVSAAGQPEPHRVVMREPATAGPEERG